MILWAIIGWYFSGLVACGIMIYPQGNLSAKDIALALFFSLFGPMTLFFAVIDWLSAEVDWNKKIWSWKR